MHVLDLGNIFTIRFYKVDIGFLLLADFLTWDWYSSEWSCNQGREIKEAGQGKEEQSEEDPRGQEGSAPISYFSCALFYFLRCGICKWVLTCCCRSLFRRRPATPPRVGRRNKPGFSLHVSYKKSFLTWLGRCPFFRLYISGSCAIFLASC